MNKPIWPRIPGPLKWIIGCLGAWLIWGALDSIITKEKFFRSVFYSTPQILLKIKLPAIFFIIVIIPIILVLVNFNKRFKGLSDKRFKELFLNNQRMQRHNDQLVEQMNQFFKENEQLSEKDRALLSEVKGFWHALNPLGFRYIKGVYWKIDDNGKIVEGPFCPACFDNEKKTIHLKESGSLYYTCHVCKFAHRKET